MRQKSLTRRSWTNSTKSIGTIKLLLDKKWCHSCILLLLLSFHPFPFVTYWVVRYLCAYQDWLINKLVFIWLIENCFICRIVLFVFLGIYSKLIVKYYYIWKGHIMSSVAATPSPPPSGGSAAATQSQQQQLNLRGSGGGGSMGWTACLPANCGLVHDISDEAVWSLSSCKGYACMDLIRDVPDGF